MNKMKSIIVIAVALALVFSSGIAMAQPQVVTKTADVTVVVPQYIAISGLPAIDLGVESQGTVTGSSPFAVATNVSIEITYSSLSLLKGGIGPALENAAVVTGDPVNGSTIVPPGKNCSVGVSQEITLNDPPDIYSGTLTVTATALV